jgi:hypothetical protein
MQKAPHKDADAPEIPRTEQESDGEAATTPFPWIALAAFAALLLLVIFVQMMCQAS